ncbi:unnamed protein product [Closterium sp. Naga37s-1]|nr:unnamed protein product [Closterium sp. Naga37s-1]
MDGENGCTPANPKCSKLAADFDVVTSKACDVTDAASAHGAAVSTACGAEPAASGAQPRQPALSTLSLAPVTPGADEVSTKHRSRLTESDCSPEPTIEKNRNSPPEDDAEKGETCASAETQAERLHSASRAAERRRFCGDSGESEERMRAQLADARKMVRALVGELAARDVEGDDDVASGDDDEDWEDDDADGRDQGEEFDLTKHIEKSLSRASRIFRHFYARTRQPQALRQERRVVRLKQQLARARAERVSLEAEMRAERAEWRALEAEARRGRAGARTGGAVTVSQGYATGLEAKAESFAAEAAEQGCVEAGARSVAAEAAKNAFVEAGARSEEQMTGSEQASSVDGCCCCGGSRALEELQAQAMVAQGEVYLVQAQLERAQAQLQRVQDERRKERERHKGALKQFVRFAMEDREREKRRAEEELGRERREMEERRRKELGGLEEEVERLRREVEKGRERERERVQEAWERGRKEGVGEGEFMRKVIGEGERRVAELRARVRELEEEKGEAERERREWDAERREWEAETRRMEGEVKGEQARRRAVEAALRRVEVEVVELRRARGAVEGERRAAVREVQREVVWGRERVEELEKGVAGLTGEVGELKGDVEGLKGGEARQAAWFEEAGSSPKGASVYVCRVASLPNAMPTAATRTGVAAATARARGAAAAAERASSAAATAAAAAGSTRRSHLTGSTHVCARQCCLHHAHACHTSQHACARMARAAIPGVARSGVPVESTQTHHACAATPGAPSPGSTCLYGAEAGHSLASSSEGSEGGDGGAAVGCCSCCPGGDSAAKRTLAQGEPGRRASSSSTSTGTSTSSGCLPHLIALNGNRRGRNEGRGLGESGAKGWSTVQAYRGWEEEKAHHRWSQGRSMSTGGGEQQGQEQEWEESGHEFISLLDGLHLSLEI